MMINVKHAAYSPSIHEVQDVCVGLLDNDAAILASAPGLPMFLADIGEVGRAAYEESCRLVLDHGERLARAAVSEIPDGTYHAEAFLDDDGIAVDVRVPIRVRVEVAGDQMTVDFSDFADQTAGSINTGPA